MSESELRRDVARADVIGLIMARASLAARVLPLPRVIRIRHPHGGTFEVVETVGGPVYNIPWPDGADAPVVVDATPPPSA